jgi:hypothetical protein
MQVIFFFTSYNAQPLNIRADQFGPLFSVFWFVFDI